jgi:hypothetical protein
VAPQNTFQMMKLGPHNRYTSCARRQQAALGCSAPAVSGVAQCVLTVTRGLPKRMVPSPLLGSRRTI